MGKLYKIGNDSWRHGTPTNWDAKDWHSYLGPCPQCGKRTYDYGGAWRCITDYCSKSASNPAPSVGKMPEWWDTDINIDIDGNMFCAFRDGFTNMMECDIGFGETPHIAVKNLISNKKIK